MNWIYREREKKKGTWPKAYNVFFHFEQQWLSYNPIKTGLSIVDFNSNMQLKMIVIEQKRKKKQNEMYRRKDRLWQISQYCFCYCCCCLSTYGLLLCPQCLRFFFFHKEIFLWQEIISLIQKLVWCPHILYFVFFSFLFVSRSSSYLHNIRLFYRIILKPKMKKNRIFYLCLACFHCLVYLVGCAIIKNRIKKR